jgi:ribonuclease P protein component
MENLHENNIATKRKFSFKKEERLTSKKVIDKLFSEGDSFLSFPLKIVFYETSLPSKYPSQVAFSVGKRSFKLAVNRNKIKRKMRETYRLNKHQLYNVLGDKQVAVFFIFIGKEIPEYEQVNIAMEKGIKKLIAKISSV